MGIADTRMDLSRFTAGSRMPGAGTPGKQKTSKGRVGKARGAPCRYVG